MTREKMIDPRLLPLADEAAKDCSKLYDLLNRLEHLAEKCRKRLKAAQRRLAILSGDEMTTPA